MGRMTDVGICYSPSRFVIIIAGTDQTTWNRVILRYHEFTKIYEVKAREGHTFSTKLRQFFFQKPIKLIFFSHFSVFPNLALKIKAFVPLNPMINFRLFLFVFVFSKNPKLPVHVLARAASFPFFLPGGYASLGDLGLVLHCEVRLTDQDGLFCRNISAVHGFICRRKSSR